VRGGPAFKPFMARGRRTIAAILLTFALSSAVTVALSIRATAKARHGASVLEVATRQRMLAERYVREVLIVRAGGQADPGKTAELLSRSAAALLDGGIAPAVDGDDDETVVLAATGRTIREQLKQEERLVEDLTATGSALLEGRPVDAVPLTAHERLDFSDPVLRLRVLAALTANVSLNTAHTIAAAGDSHIETIIVLQIALGAVGLMTSLLLAYALIGAARRQTAHFRSLVTSSTDLVLVFGAGRCRYVSQSVSEILGRAESEVLGDGFAQVVHPDDRALLHAATTNGDPRELVIRMANRVGEWRHLEARVTDLRGDRHVRGVVLNARDVTERVHLDEQLTRQAFHDGLTDLANRALFRDRLDQALARSERSRDVLAILLLDLDGFKQVNDSLGHDAGDRLLEQVADRFRSVTRPGDTLARLGGDEFALLLEGGADEASAVAVADRLLDCLAEPLLVANHELKIDASIGIAMHPGGKTSGEDLIRHADLAMYAAKEAGRGGREIFQYEMAREFGELLGLEHELRLGLQRSEFSVHYQPEISLERGDVVGVEALLRWNSPTRGPVAPLQFIPVAEATGLIHALGEFVLREACKQTAEWRRRELLPEKFVTWVNLSGKQLSAGGISKQVQRELSAAGLPAEFLGLEVTETAVVQGGAVGERARGELQELHDLGIRIAIDDFGTGFSSLGQLRHFPIDMIKVDRSFVQGVEHDAKDAAIAANLVNLAHALGLVAIAEGIESKGQLASLRELGCDLAQGYLFARPAPAEQLGDMLTPNAEAFPTADSDEAAA
jgi:diguanylate cyclase (GGDEF)-like protein/PAS domain S-box-containing protein